MKLYVNQSLTSADSLARVVIDMTQQNVELVTVTDEYRKTPGYKALSTTDKLPLFVCPEGTLHESTAIAKYFCNIAGGKMLGSSPVERSQVDQWIAFMNTSIFQHYCTIFFPIFGEKPDTAANFNEAVKELKAKVKIIDGALKDKQWLVGNDMTIADVAVANILLNMF